MTSPIRVLLVEDSPTDAKLVVAELRHIGRPIEFDRVDTAEAMRVALAQREWDLVISDWSMPKFDALAALAVYKESSVDVPFIIVSGTIGEETAVEAMRAGARDFVLKDKLARLSAAVERELRESETRRALRAAEVARRDAERRAQQIVDSASVGMWMLDARGATTFMNPQMARILGMEVAEAIRTPTVEFFPEEDRAAFLARQTQRRAGHASTYEQTFIGKGGVRRRIAMEVGPVFGSDGMFEGSIAIATDVTERWEMQAALRASDARYRRIVETTRQGVCVVDAEGMTTFANERMAELVECPVEALLGASLIEFLDANGQAALTEHWDSHRRGGSEQSEIRLLGRNGGRRWVIVDSSPMRDDAGKYEGAFATMTDVTERRNAQDALRASESRFAYLFQSGIMGISIARTEGTILEANDTFLQMVGSSREALVAGTVDWGKITARESLEPTKRSVRLAMESGVSPPYEKDYVCPDGRRVSVLAGVAKLDETTCIAFSIDVTARKTAEKALKASEELLRQAQKMEAVGRLAGGIAHDFNNILSVILSYADILLGEISLDDEKHGDVNEIRTAGRRAAELTRQLLMFSRQQVLEPKVVDLNDVLAAMDKMLKRLVGADVAFTTLPGPKLGLVRVDPSSMDQVIMNLVVNARDAMPTGGQLKIQTSTVFLDDSDVGNLLVAKPGAHVLLSVADTGTGIDAAHLAHIFEPFFTTKDQGKGTGLGLSTVFGIVQQNGGTLRVDSVVGKGTTFEVYLPCVDASVDMATRSMAPLVGLRGTETILLVEDDDQVRVVAKGILLRAGYHVIDARNAGEALLHSEEHAATIHLLLTDVVMPQMSGPALAKRLVGVRPDMKVLCMSGYTDDSIVRHGVLAARFAYLQKPITPETLTTKVREVLDDEALSQRTVSVSMRQP